MGLARVSVTTIVPFVACVIEFDRGDDARVRPQYHEVDGKLADSVEDALHPTTALKCQQLYDLHLRKHDVAGQRVSQAPKKLSLALRQKVALWLKWPSLLERSHALSLPCF